MATCALQTGVDVSLVTVGDGLRRRGRNLRFARCEEESGRAEDKKGLQYPREQYPCDR